MNKKLVGILAGMVCLVAVLSGCGFGNAGKVINPQPSASSSSAKPSPDSSSKSSDSSSDGTMTNGKYNSIEDFVKSDAVQSQLSTALAQAKAGGMSMNVYGDGNVLVYEYTMPANITASTPGVADSLNNSLNSSAATFTSVATSMKAAVNVDNPIVRVTYIDTTGAVIATKDFPAN